MTAQDKREAIEYWCICKFKDECFNCPIDKLTADGGNCYTDVPDATIEARYQLLIDMGFDLAYESEECE